MCSVEDKEGNYHMLPLSVALELLAAQQEATAESSEYESTESGDDD